MNKRIQELAVQAGMRKCSLGYGMPENVLWGDADIEKFAELIVRECMVIAEKQQKPANLNYSPSERFIQDLEAHFRIYK